MLCALSGEAPQEPVASKKSGQVFERRLIESYIADNGKDPITGEELATDDLIALQTARVVKPRPPTLTSIPALLTTFQNEWDSLALETFTLKQRVNGIEQQLSTALYNYDGAVRVIARLTKERDEARDALNKVSVTERRQTVPTVTPSAPPTTNGKAEDAMEVDQVALPASIVEKVEETKQRLSATRRKRPIPEGWATSGKISSFKPMPLPDMLVPAGSQALAIDPSGKMAVLGGLDGAGCIFSIQKKQTLRILDVSEGPITDVVCLDLERDLSSAVATSTGGVKIFEGETEVAEFKAHAGSANALALHPSKEILASVGEDSRTVLYDLVEKRVLVERSTDTGEPKCCQFHPDGNLFAVGISSKGKGFINVHDFKTLETSAQFSLDAPVRALSFSENGFWLAVALQDSSVVEIWDLRKAVAAHKLDFGSRIDAIEWDYTGQYLAAGGPKTVAVQHWDKSSKSWSQPLSKSAAITALRWGPMASGLAVLYTDGSFGAFATGK